MEECARVTEYAAWRNAWFARLCTFIVRDRKTFPPEMSLWGANPSHEQKCLTVGNRSISVPISLIMVCTVMADNPITATRSTPITRAIWARALKVMAFFDLDSPLADGILQPSQRYPETEVYHDISGRH